MTDCFDTVRKKVDKTFSQYGMDTVAKGGVLVALSGGADSVLLLYLLKQKAEAEGFLLKAAHINHGIRGKEAERDESFCRSLCDSLNIPLICRAVDVPTVAQKEKTGLEETARKLRYASLREIMDAEGLSAVVTAHNATDDAETVLFHLLRGSGLRGMCGIPPVRGFLLRPLLSVTRAEVEAAIAELGLSYVTDSTNADTAYTRNFLRHRILPAFEERFEKADASIARSAKNLASDADCLDTLTKQLMEEKGITHRIQRELFNSLHPAIRRRVTERMYANAGGTAMAEQVHFEKIFELSLGDVPAFRLSLPGKLDFVCRDGELFFGKEEKATLSYRIPLQMGENLLPSGDVLYLSTDKADSGEFPLPAYELFATGDLGCVRISGNLYARNRESGDSYRFGGMTRKVKKLFNQAKIPLSLRGDIPLICDNDGICWVPQFSAREDGQKNNLYVYFYRVGGKDE